MSLARTPDRLQLPATLQSQLHQFRRRVWSVKMAEAIFAALFGVVVAFLVMYALDRLTEPPQWSRAALFVVIVFSIALVPHAAHRWIWRNRRLEQLARLLSRKHPHVGDQLLGIIELVRSDSEQRRSRRLCEAAIVQVAEAARKRDFRDSVPNPRPLLWAALAALPTAAAIGLFVLYPAAATNAATRVFAPWSSTPRYAFTSIEPLPDRLVIAHGEPFVLNARLTDATAWRPARGIVRVGAQAPVSVRLREGAYAFALPPQLDPATVDLRIGDVRKQFRIEPTMRPELTSVVAEVTLPEYLHRPAALKKDAHGGSIGLVKGSRATIVATASRALSSAQVDGRDRKPVGPRVTSPRTSIAASRAMEFRWRDAVGLAGKEPFTLAINGRDDEAPSLSCEDLPRQKVVLDSEPLNFKARAQDDFGIKRIGMEWQGVADSLVKSPAKGEKILAAGGPEKDALELSGTFSATGLKIEPQQIQVRLFAEDYFPGRERVYSPTYTLFVLNAEQHAIWLTEQLSKWHRQSLEVRDREMQLYETNKQLRTLAADELDQPETRRKIETQAASERANGKRLSGLVMNGEDLVRQAMRNPEFGVGHLEKWAEMLQILKDISANRMPSVADLLKNAAQAPTQVASTPSNQGPKAGQIRDGRSGASGEPPPAKRPPTSVPTLADRESSQQPPDKTPVEPSKSKGSSPSLRLPVTTVLGKGGPPKPPAPAAAKVDEAVIAQKDLLAEFEKVADELNKVLANLEGSTLVKRLKAASRLQYKIAGRINDQVSDAFGVAPARFAESPRKVLGELSEGEAKASHDLSIIMDDMQSYFERRRFAKFKTVLDEMRAQDAIGGIRQLGADLGKETGISIAQCEFWSDTLDRWADNLVDPSNCGACPGAKSRDSLPPSVVLEVLQILESEVNLREETRVAEQAKDAVTSDEHGKQGHALAETQTALRVRIEKVIKRILELPDAPSQFGKELKLLAQVGIVMEEASGILARPETGSPAIAAETEVIELLLQSKRINPKGGGGGGAAPGGGSGGPTNDSALALIGGGVNDKEVREDHGISGATGETGSALPEEFRAGLDEYFNRLEGRSGGR